jgi:hypothetical protein
LRLALLEIGARLQYGKTTLTPTHLVAETSLKVLWFKALVGVAYFICTKME